MGSIYKRGNIYWVAYVDLNGKQQCESARNRSAGTKGNHSDAVRLLNLREGKLAEGIAVTPQTGKLVLDDALNAVLQDHDVNQRRSKEHVKRRIELHIKPYFGINTRLASIGSERLRAYVAHRTQEGASPATCNRELSIVRRAFRLALEGERVTSVPKFPMLDESRNVRQGFLEPADFEKVRAAIHPEVYADAATLAYVTGWRLPSEVLPLTWAQVDQRAGLIRMDVGVTKGGEGRQFPITATLRKLLKRRERQKRDGCALVFHEDGEAIHRRTFHKAWTVAREQVGMSDSLVHDFRRSAVRNFERLSIPRKVAMQMVGHKTESIYRRYHIVAEADIHAAGARLDASATSETSTTKLLQSKNRRQAANRKIRKNTKRIGAGGENRTLMRR